MLRSFSFVSVLLSLVGCQTSGGKPPLATVSKVEIKRFMGPWYVIANMPTFLEVGAHNAIEEYILRDDGAIDVNFTFRKDSFDGPKREYHPRGFVDNKETNATWGMQFIWPFKTDFLIIDLADDYSWTVIGVPSRSYVWIMAREPKLDEGVYKKIARRLGEIHLYDISKLQLVPQKH